MFGVWTVTFTFYLLFQIHFPEDSLSFFYSIQILFLHSFFILFLIFLHPFMNVQIVCKTPWTFRPPNYNLPIQAYFQTMYVWNMNISWKTELIKQSKLNKITTTAEIKWQRLREERCKHKDNIAMCYQRRNRSPRRKTSPSPSKRSIIH